MTFPSILVSESSDFHRCKLFPIIERTVARDGMIIYEQDRDSRRMV